MDNQRYEDNSYYRPLSPWGYVGYSILFGLPCIGLVLIIVFALNNDNINRRNFARFFLCWLLIAVIIIAIIMLTGLLPAISQQIRSYQYFR